MSVSNVFNAEVKRGVPVVQNNDTRLDVKDQLLGGVLGNNNDSAIFTRIIENDPAFAALLQTTESRMLKGVRNGRGQGLALYDKDEKGNFTIKGAPKMSLSPMTAKPDDCCVVAGDLQVCNKAFILKPLCLEKCESGMEAMMNDRGAYGAEDNSIVYQAYLGLLRSSGVPKKAYPSLEEFETMSLIAQFILLNMLTFLNGMLDIEQNGNIIRRFNGLAETYAQPDVYNIDGSVGIIEAFEQAVCRMNIVGRGRFNNGFFMADTIAYTAIQQAIVKKQDGTYPTGWTVRDVSVTRDGQTYTDVEYSFLGHRIIKSDLLYVDPTTMTGKILWIPDSLGVFSGIPLDMPAEFIMQEWNRKNSPYIHWDEDKKAYPDCWSNCVSITNFGTIVATDANDLFMIDGISGKCDVKAYEGLEGLININSLAPFVA